MMTSLVRSSIIFQVFASFLYTTAGQSANKYEKEPVNEEDFPSLQEAALMARGCKIESAARKQQNGL